MLRSGLLGTPLGEKMWTSNIKAIVQATLRTINLAIMQLAVHQEPYINALCDTRLRIYPSQVRQRHALSREAVLFGAVQKKYGFEQLIGSMQQIFLDRGVDADMVIVPGDTAALLRCRQETRDFALNGALAQMYQLDPMRSLPSYIYNERFTLFEHRGMFVNSEGQRDSPMVRERSIGQFFVIEEDQEIDIIDHDNQRWHTIRWTDAVKKAEQGFKIPHGTFHEPKEFPPGGGAGPNSNARDKEYRPRTAARAGSQPAQIDMAAVAQSANWRRNTWTASRASHAQTHFGGVTSDNFGTPQIQAGFAALAKDLKQNKFGMRLGTMDAEVAKAQASAAAQVLFGDSIGGNPPANYPRADGGAVPDAVPSKKIVIFRPNVTFRMGAVVAGRGGEETGFTAFGNANFELSDEATTKTALGHYTCYFKPIVHTPKNLMVSPDAVFQGYVGGGGVTAYDDFTDYAKNPYSSRGMEGGKDLLYMFVPEDWSCDGVLSSMGYGKQYEGLMDTCSSWGTSIFVPGATSTTTAKDQAFEAFRNMASFFEGVNAGHHGSHGENLEIPFHERRYGVNHICYQGTQMTRTYEPGNPPVPAQGSTPPVPGTQYTKEKSRSLTPARGHLSGCEYLDSSVREWSGHIAFRDNPILTEDVTRANKRNYMTANP